MTDLTTLQGQLEALKSARRSGVSTAGYGDKRVEYRSDEDMQAAISAIETEIAKMEGTLNPRIAVVRSTKGW